MNKTKNSKLTGLSKSLRKNMTKEERRLWYDFLKDLPITVHRQKVIGNYIADFYCANSGIVIELDGSGHFEPEQILKDREKDAFFNSLGIMVLRFSNLEVLKNFDGVCEEIYNHLFECK